MYRFYEYNTFLRLKYDAAYNYSITVVVVLNLYVFMASLLDETQICKFQNRDMK